VDEPILISARHMDAPWIAAHLAVLNEAAMDVRLDVDLYLLATKRTGDQELIWHARPFWAALGRAEALRYGV